jgi:hypothetical protein
MKTVIVALLAVLAPVAVLAQDYPVTFGEIAGGKIVASPILKNCEPSTGYKYGFEMSLPEGEKHVVRIRFMTPPIPGQDCVSCRSFTDDFGTHSGHFVQPLELGSEVGTYSLKIYVDDWKQVHAVDYRAVASKSCP